MIRPRAVVPVDVARNALEVDGVGCDRAFLIREESEEMRDGGVLARVVKKSDRGLPVGRDRGERRLGKLGVDFPEAGDSEGALVDLLLLGCHLGGGCFFPFSFLF